MVSVISLIVKSGRDNYLKENSWFEGKKLVLKATIHFLKRKKSSNLVER